MTLPRSCHQLVALGGFLYAIGGYSDGARVATAECYDPATNTWTPIASMASVRNSFAAAPMGGFLYVTGGLGVAGLLSSPASNTWSRIADLPEPHQWDHALGCLGGSLHAVGGGGCESGWLQFSSVVVRRHRRCVGGEATGRRLG